jgi:hypothetical protein
MGAHAPQLNKEEIWKLVYFIRTKFMEKVPELVAPPEVEVVTELVTEVAEVIKEDKGTEEHGH